MGRPRSNSKGCGETTKIKAEIGPRRGNEWRVWLFDRDMGTNLTVMHALDLSAATRFCNLTHRVIQQQQKWTISKTYNSVNLKWTISKSYNSVNLKWTLSKSYNSVNLKWTHSKSHNTVNLASHQHPVCTKLHMYANFPQILALESCTYFRHQRATLFNMATLHY
jgi:hypothetical protein